MHGTKTYSIDSSSEGDDEDHPSIQAANQNPPPLDNTYVYRDFAREEDPAEKFVTAHAGHSNLIGHEDMRDLERQKLPAKLAAMLSDPGEFLISGAVNYLIVMCCFGLTKFFSLSLSTRITLLSSLHIRTPRYDRSNRLHHLDAPRPLLENTQP
jgi:hypothetical protein